MSESIPELMGEILRFRDQREWGQFHTLKNLAAALSIEAAELQETMLWNQDSELTALLQKDPAFKDHVAEEIADVLIYALLLCNEIDVEPLNAIRSKLALNEKKYPLEKSRGNATKHDQLPSTRPQGD